MGGFAYKLSRVLKVMQESHVREDTERVYVLGDNQAFHFLPDKRIYVLVLREVLV